MKKIFLVLISSALLVSSCDQLIPGDAEKAGPEKPAAQSYEDFVFPEPIKQHHVMATFYDADHQEHGVIFLNDTSSKNATVLRFTPDGKQVMSDSLWAVRSNEFVSIKTKAQYIIRERVVGYSTKTSETQIKDHILGYIRTDVPTAY